MPETPEDGSHPAIETLPVDIEVISHLSHYLPKRLRYKPLVDDHSDQMRITIIHKLDTTIDAI